jgi:hypothetical protein
MLNDTHTSPSTESKRIPHIGFDRVLLVLSQWLGALSPVLVVLISGFVLFRAAIVASIASTPHPELVYVILGTFAVGVVLTCITLWRYTFEGNLMTRWVKTQDAARRRLLVKRYRATYLLPVYQILLGDRTLSATTRQATLEQEMKAVNERLSDRLSLPHYLSGALVGLGLVGTFVGLLGTLEDLGKLFASLVNTSDSGLNPTEVFADMVRRLQDPMRGMGTAFVASLYGLLGSLILGLNILAIGKIGNGLSTQMHALVRNSDAVSRTSSVKPDGPTQPWHNTPSLQAEQWQEIATSIQTQQAQSTHDTQLLRREMLTVIDASKRVTQAIYESIRADERYRTSVPRTSYWQDAWVKVQAYLQRSNTDQVLAELSRSARIQNQTLVDISLALHRIDDHLRAHLVSQITHTPADFDKTK